MDGTRVLLEAAADAPLAKFLFVSSSTVYGANAEIPFRELNRLGEPTSPYGASKQEAEAVCRDFAENKNVPVVCVRPFNVYGPGMRPDLAITVFANAIIQGAVLPVYGNGSVRRDFSHVSDVCCGMYQALIRPESIGATINLGYGNPVTVQELIRLLEKALGKSANIQWHAELPQDLPVTFACLEQAREFLDYQPRISLEEGINDYCKWLNESVADSGEPAIQENQS